MKIIQAFLFVSIIGFCFTFNACVTPKDSGDIKSETIVSQKEKPIPSKSVKKTNPEKKPEQKNNDLSKNQKNNIKSSSTKQNHKKKQASTKPAKKESSKNIVSDTNKSEKDRLKALHTFDRRAISQADYLVLKNLVQNEREDLKIRQEALKKIYKPCGKDEEMLDYLFSIIQGKNDELKKEVLYALQTLKYSSPLLQKKQPYFLNALKTGIYNTNDKKTYYMLLKALNNANDPAAHEIVIDLLKQEDFSKISSKQLLQFLQKNVRSQHYPMLQRIMQNSKNIKLKKQLIPLLINHPNSKANFIKYLGDKNEEIETRLVCADALIKHDKFSFYTITKNIIWDKEDDIILRRRCLSLIDELDLETLEKYVNLYDDMLNIGLSDNILNQLRESLLKKINKNQY